MFKIMISISPNRTCTGSRVKVRAPNIKATREIHEMTEGLLIGRSKAIIEERTAVRLELDRVLMSKPP